MARKRNSGSAQKSRRSKRGHAQSVASPKHGGRAKRSLLSRLKFW